MEKPAFFTKTAVVAEGNKIGAKHGFLFCSCVVDPNIIGNRGLSSAFEYTMPLALRSVIWAADNAEFGRAAAGRLASVGVSGVTEICGRRGGSFLIGVVSAREPSESVDAEKRLIRGGRHDTRCSLKTCVLA
jgi:hypothetical protein